MFMSKYHQNEGTSSLLKTHGICMFTATFNIVTRVRPVAIQDKLLKFLGYKGTGCLNS